AGAAGGGASGASLDTEARASVRRWSRSRPRVARVTEQGGDGRRIVAVVVTFNRLALLQRLLERLDGVVGLDEVLVVRNASTDGTSAWLASLEPGAEGADGHAERRVLARTLTTNTGGAGGFSEGLTWAVERGAHLAWLMDDDGVPAPDCLDRLLALEDHGYG